jgi:tetratricopeptide (TPR) repeat protein
MERDRRAVLVPLRAHPADLTATGLEQRTIHPRDGSSLVSADHAELAWRGALAGVLEGVTLCHVTIGDIQLEREREALATASFRRALVIAEGLVTEDPDDEPNLALLALVRDRVGDALLAAGDGPNAFTAYDSARIVRERLVRDAPLNRDKRRALARCFESIGEVLRAIEDKPPALDAYRACLALRERLAEETADPRERREVYTTYGRIGHVLRAMGDTAASVHAFRTGLSIAEALAAEGDDDGTSRADHALFCFRIATVLVDGGDADRDEARALLGRAKVTYAELEAAGLLLERQSIWPPAVDALLDTLDT